MTKWNWRPTPDDGAIVINPESERVIELMFAVDAPQLVEALNRAEGLAALLAASGRAQRLLRQVAQGKTLSTRVLLNAADRLQGEIVALNQTRGQP